MRAKEIEKNEYKKVIFIYCKNKTTTTTTSISWQLKTVETNNNKKMSQILT